MSGDVAAADGSQFRAEAGELAEEADEAG